MDEAEARKILQGCLWVADEGNVDYEGSCRSCRTLLARSSRTPTPSRSSSSTTYLMRDGRRVLPMIIYLVAEERPGSLRVARGEPPAQPRSRAGHGGREHGQTGEAETMLTEEGIELVALAVEHPGIIPDLIDAFMKRRRLRRRLGLILHFVAQKRPEVIDQVISHLFGDDRNVIGEVISVVSDVKVEGTRARNLARALMTLYSHPGRGQMRGNVPDDQLVALARGPGGNEVVGLVVTRLRAEPAWDVSRHLYLLLQEMADNTLDNSPAGPARATLLDLMADADRRVRSGALLVGGVLDGEEVTRVVVQALADVDGSVRLAAVQSMTSWSPERLAGVRDALNSLLSETVAGVAKAAAYCLRWPIARGPPQAKG